MAQVTLDIVGLYFDATTTVPDGSTIKDVMLQIEAETRNEAKRLVFGTEIRSNGREFIDWIMVQHSERPVSRQRKEKTYPAGTYVASDTDTEVLENTRIKGLTLVWQYYLYDRSGVDKSRKKGGQLTRKIVPFSEEKVEDGDHIVWRLVGIMVEPSFPSDGIKSGNLTS